MNQITLLGEPCTIGELKKLIEPFDDDTSFGFRNQPMQELTLIRSNGQLFVVFNETRPKFTKEVFLKAQKKFNEMNIPLRPKMSFGKAALISHQSEPREVWIIGDEDSVIKYCKAHGYTWEYFPFFIA